MTANFNGALSEIESALKSQDQAMAEIHAHLTEQDEKMKAFTESHAKKSAGLAMALVQLDQLISRNLSSMKPKDNRDQVNPEERYNSHQVLGKLKQLVEQQLPS